MIQLALIALSVVLLGLQCKHLTAEVGSGFRPTDVLSPECMRALLEQARREQAQLSQRPVEASAIRSVADAGS
jgi:hypothetical protein